MRKLEVRLHWGPGKIQNVGILAENERHIFFEYDSEFLKGLLELSPFKLRGAPGLLEHRDLHFGPLPGLFDDALPDGWGRLLMDRAFRMRRIDPQRIGPLDQLAYIGTRAIGALTFHPPEPAEKPDHQLLDLHALGEHSIKVYSGDAKAILPELFRAGGSPAGARPKVLVGVKGDEIISGADDLPDAFEPWIVKFHARADDHHAGRVEMACARMAAAAGLELPEVRLFEAGPRQSYFGAKRFDRLPGNRRTHVHSFANLIHANFRLPSTDYEQLLKVTLVLTRNHADLLQAARRMAFNVAASNRDDHAKNFAFVMDDKGTWSSSPAYDLTYSQGPGGEHTMSVGGEGATPGKSDLLRVALQTGLKPIEMQEIIDSVNESVMQWKRFADEARVPAIQRNKVGRALRTL